MSEHPDPKTEPAAFRLWLNDLSVSLNKRIYAVVRLVPAGHVTTYGDVGRVMGFVGLARQVGWALSALTEDNQGIPWQRVINRHGSISYRGSLDRAQQQQHILEDEGITFNPEGCCDLSVYRWHYEGLLDL